MVEFGPFNGNCGCFGEAIPMKPIEAFIKNIITIGLLVWLFKLLPNKKESWKNIIYPILIFLLSALFMFMRFSFCPCDKKPVTTEGSGIDTSLVDINEISAFKGADDRIFPPISGICPAPDLIIDNP